MLTSVAVSVIAIIVLAVALVVGHGASRRERVLTPLLLFCSIEIVAVWPGLVPGLSINHILNSFYPLLLAIVGLLAFVVAYCLTGGASVSLEKWRGDRFTPGTDQIRLIRYGLLLWVALLVAVELYRFGGMPPLLTGGLRTLINPLENVDQVSSIRETRRELTKGHTVMGAEYAGQGIINTVTSTGWQTVAVTAALLFSWTRRRRDALVAALLIGIAFVFIGSAGSRLPLILMALAVVILFSVRHRASTKHIVWAGVTLVGLVLLIVPLSKGATTTGGVYGRFEAALERVAQGNGQNNAMIVHLVDRGSLPEAWGGLFVERTLASLPGVSGGAEPFALRLTRLAYGAGQGTTGYSTPTQFGLMYADGGPLLVVLGYGVMGAVLAFGWRALASSNAWYGPVLAAQGSLLLAYTSVTGVHGVPPTLLMIVVAIVVMGTPHYLQRPAQKAPVNRRATRVRSRVTR